MTADTDRNRWLALYVLCAGMLMIVLDATIVNVALPVDPGRPRLLPEQPRLGRQRLPDRLRRPAAAGRPPRRPDRPAARLPRRARRSSPPPRCCARVAQSQEMLIGARFVQGVGGALTSAVILGHDRDDVPRAAGAGEGDRRLRLRRLGRRLDRPARRRRAHRGDQLALDLLRQPADRHRDRRCSPLRLRRARARASASRAGADVPGAVLHHRLR